MIIAKYIVQCGKIMDKGIIKLPSETPDDMLVVVAIRTIQEHCKTLYPDPCGNLKVLVCKRGLESGFDMEKAS